SARTNGRSRTCRAYRSARTSRPYRSSRSHRAAGPIGDPGPTGPPGSDGASDVYIARNNLIGPLDGPGKDVLSLTVLPGSYLINATVTMTNADGDDQGSTCNLSTGDHAANMTPGHQNQTFVMYDTATFNTTTTITLHCNGFQNFANQDIMTALKVGALH